MNIYVILLLSFLAVFAIIFLIMRKLNTWLDPTLRRMKEIEKLQKTGGKDLQQKTRMEKRWPDHLSIEKILERIGKIAQSQTKPDSKLKSNLIAAGYYSDVVYTRLKGIKIFTAIAAFILFTYLGSFGPRPFHIVLLMALVAGVAFFILPDVFLGFRVRKRQSIIAATLPDALDLLVISVEAGLGLNAAILRVGQDMAMRSQPLSQEFMRATQDLRTGISREKALRALAERNRVEDLKILVGSLVLADRLGTSIGATLRAQADSLRTRIRQKAEEQAAKAGIKMLLPLVLFILPALFIVLMGPAMLMMMETLAK